MTTCSKCFSEIENDSFFCSNCGFSMKPDHVVKNGHYTVGQSNPIRNSEKIEKSARISNYKDYFFKRKRPRILFLALLINYFSIFLFGPLTSLLLTSYFSTLFHVVYFLILLLAFYSQKLNNTRRIFIFIYIFALQICLMSFLVIEILIALFQIYILAFHKGSIEFFKFPFEKYAYKVNNNYSVCLYTIHSNFNLILYSFVTLLHFFNLEKFFFKNIIKYFRKTRYKSKA